MNTTATYLNTTVFCKLAPSSVHGVGVFAIRDIPKGTELTDYYPHNIRSLVSIPKEDFYQIHKEIRKLILDKMLYSEDMDVLHLYSPNADQIFQSFMNHSFTPNSDGVYAIIDINQGEEITEDYSLLELNPSKLNIENFKYD